MQTETEQICELWDEAQPVPLTHSRLFPLRPIGIESAQVESLTSYIMRLADAHSVHPYTMIYKELAPRLNRPFLYKNGELVGPFGPRSVALNGITPTASLLVEILEQLTLRRDLRFLTLLTFAEVLSLRNLVKPAQAWCPECYQAWRDAGHIIYTPLLWAFACVKVCPVHSRYLHFQCPDPRCNRKLPALTLQGRIGYCPRCRQWLGSTPHEAERIIRSEDEWVWQKWVATTVGEILASAPDLSTPPLRTGFAKAVATLVREKNGSPLQLARQLHVHQMSVFQWRNGQKSPQLETLLRISAYSGISPVSLMTGNIEGPLLFQKRFQLDISPFLTEPKTRRGRIDIEKVLDALEAALTEDPPPSRSEVARRLGFAPDNLNKLCPGQCRAIAARHREYLSKRRAEGVKMRCEQVKQAVRLLYNQGRFPSKRQIEMTLNKPALFRERAVKIAWEEALRELGFL